MAAMPARRRPPNIILVLLDDVGIDMLRSYRDVIASEGGTNLGNVEDYVAANPGYTHAKGYAQTPIIEEIAARGIRFNRAYA